MRFLAGMTGKRRRRPAQEPAPQPAPAAAHRIVREILPIRGFEPLGNVHCDELLRFWFDNRRNDTPPDWSCFRPERHPALLPQILLYEMRGDQIIVRIIGEKVALHLPQKSGGKAIENVVPGNRVEDVKMRLRRAVSDGLPNYVEKLRLWQQNSFVFGYNALSIPFVSERDGHDRVLCVIEMRREPA